MPVLLRKDFKNDEVHSTTYNMVAWGRIPDCHEGGQAISGYSKFAVVAKIEYPKRSMSAKYLIAHSTVRVVPRTKH